MKKFISLLIVFQSLIVFSQDFEVAPVYVNFQVEPGNNESRKVSIINHSDKNQVFNLKLTDYEPDTTGRSIRMKAGESTRSLVDMITFAPSFLELPPNGQGYVNLNLTVPPNDFASKWGLVSVEATQERTAADVDKTLATGIMINPRISIYVFQSPKSNTNFSAKVIGISEITKPDDSKRTFEATVENVGEKRITAKLSIMLANINTGEEKDLGQKTETIYPGVKKKILFTIDSLEPGKYALAVVLDYGSKSNLEGAQITIDQE